MFHQIFTLKTTITGYTFITYTPSKAGMLMMKRKSRLRSALWCWLWVLKHPSPPYGIPIDTIRNRWSIKFGWQRFEMNKLRVLTRQDWRYEVTQLHNQVDLCSKEFNDLSEMTMRLSNRYDGPSIQTSMGTNHSYLSVAANYNDPGGVY